MADGTASELQQLESRLRELTLGLREAIDLSAALTARAPQHRADVVKLWEQLLGAFYGHLQRKGRDTGENLLGWISFSRALRYKS